MTNKEAIAILKNEKECVNRANENDYCNRDCYNCELVKPSEDILEALVLAIKALEQQPSEDCISRKAVDKLFIDAYESKSPNLKEDWKKLIWIREHIKDLPSVTPKPKNGKWVEIYAESEGSDSWIEFKCPHCGEQFGMESGQYNWHYGDAIPWEACPMCGGLAEHKPYKEDSE